MEDLRIAIVQYAGDFREASRRFANGGPENYRAQRFTVDYVHDLASRVSAVTTITGFTEEKYEETLPSGAQAVGAGFHSAFDHTEMIRAIKAFGPNRIILRTPDRRLLRWVAKSGIPTLALLADSFQAKSLKDHVTRFLTSRYLNAKCIEIVANHGKLATEQLIEMGVDRRKVIAWDYPQFNTPDQNAPKTMPAGRTAFYVGLIVAAKGVGDLVDAAGVLKQAGRPIDLRIYGNGDVEWLKTYIAQRDLEDVVSYHGVLRNDKVIETMNKSDVIVVPSRHDYGEGLPLTIYEALCSRTPLITSDHPMFKGLLRGEADVPQFRATDGQALAGRIDSLLSDPEEYERLSRNSAVAWNAIQVPTKWDRLIDDWLQRDVAALKKSA
ncbi:glycosyltransferase [Rhizobium sp. S152]|uniref:glycosyltransferase n=1 Tax=Rhizobium sp. S152 TaxID=3055038 RepID=UPI0025AA2692|nr:glycosyltransferase [Rhizobium sp. S152]MDM9628201.1 glycosyltransferase [Rhizobium sp. S152]